jgi:hypothetical protein
VGGVKRAPPLGNRAALKCGSDVNQALPLDRPAVGTASERLPGIRLSDRVACLVMEEVEDRAGFLLELVRRGAQHGLEKGLTETCMYQWLITKSRK